MRVEIRQLEIISNHILQHSQQAETFNQRLYINLRLAKILNLIIFYIIYKSRLAAKLLIQTSIASALLKLLKLSSNILLLVFCSRLDASNQCSKLTADVIDSEIVLFKLLVYYKVNIIRDLIILLLLIFIDRLETIVLLDNVFTY